MGPAEGVEAGLLVQDGRVHAPRDELQGHRLMSHHIIYYIQHYTSYCIMSYYIILFNAAGLRGRE